MYYAAKLFRLIFVILAASLSASQNSAIEDVARTGTMHEIADASSDFGFEDYDFGQELEQDSTAVTGKMDDLEGDYDLDTPPERSACRKGPGGKLILDGAYANLCQLRLSGADALAKTTPGGIDGVYSFQTCENGRPVYSRKQSPPSQERLLWYEPQHMAWDVTNGSTISKSEEHLLLYGGEAADHLRPEYVKDKWYVRVGVDPADTKKGRFEPAHIIVECASRWQKAKQKEEPKVDVVKLPKPYITQEEGDREFRAAIEPKLQERRKAEEQHAARSKAGMIGGIIVAVLAVLYYLPRCLERRLLRQKKSGDRAWLGLVAMPSKQALS